MFAGRHLAPLYLAVSVRAEWKFGIWNIAGMAISQPLNPSFEKQVVLYEISLLYC